MTDIGFDGRQIMINFGGWEAFMTRRSTYTVPVEAIASTELLDDWSSEILGVRAGLVVSGYRKLGTFTHPDGTRRLAEVRLRMYTQLVTRARRTSATDSDLYCESFRYTKTVDNGGLAQMERLLQFGRVLSRSL